MTIRFKLTFFTLAAVILAVGLCSVFSVISVRAKFEQTFYRNTRGILDSASIDIESNFIKGFLYAQNWAEDSELIDWLNSGEEAGELKTNVMKKFKNLSERAGVTYLLSPGENPTTLSDERLVSSYDNFFINKEKTKEFLENSGVYNFVKNNNYAIIKKYISDHLPIFSEYSIEYDLD